MTIHRRPHHADQACWRCNFVEAVTPAGLCTSCREQLITEAVDLRANPGEPSVTATDFVSGEDQ